MTTPEGQPKIQLDKQASDVTIPESPAAINETKVQFIENVKPDDQREYGDVPVRHVSEQNNVGGMMKKNEAKPWYKRKTVIAAGAISAAGVAIAGQQFATAADKINQITNFPDNEARLTSVPIVGQDFFETNTIQIPAAANSVESRTDLSEVDASSASLGDYYNDNIVSPAQRIDFAAPIIQENTEEAVTEIHKTLSDIGRGHYNYFNREIEEVSVNNSGQAILDQDNIKETIAWHHPDTVVGKKLIESITSDRSGHDYLMRTIGNGGAPILEIRVALEESPILYGDLSRYGITATNGLGVKIISTFEALTHNRTQIIKQLTQGKDTKNQTWQTIKVLSPDNYIKDITNITSI